MRRTGASGTSMGGGGVQEVRQFRMEELEQATRDFSETNLIGYGSFGMAFKGLLCDGTVVAVKRHIGAPRQEFSQEVYIYIYMHIEIMYVCIYLMPEVLMIVLRIIEELDLHILDVFERLCLILHLYWQVTRLSRIRHRNLVTLLGYCQESGYQMLVFEYLPNGSICSHLYGNRNKKKNGKKKEKELILCNCFHFF